ncbi:MAG: methionyl-tRNA formyltransferase, partial [Patescibacteria group bacterium]
MSNRVKENRDPEMTRALSLFSGGLDSVLSVYLIKKQGIEVEAVTFKSAFFSADRGIASAKQLGIVHRVIDFSQEHLEIVKNPKHGYGKAVNPCIDCHGLMLKHLNQVLKKEGWDFVVSGEVLGQRPMSQNKNALKLIAKESGLGDLLLRPLSARLLEPSLPEIKGWVDRRQLLDIQGRSRFKQLALAKEFGLSFPQPAGGCLLTEKEFAKKFSWLVSKRPDFDVQEAELITFGRHFWDKGLIVLGRNQAENRQLEEIATHKDSLLQPIKLAGPTVLVKGGKKSRMAEKLLLKYSKKGKQDSAIVFFGSSLESVAVLKILLGGGVKVDLVVTQPDRPAGRGQKLTPTPLAQFCQENNLKVIKPEKLDDQSLPKLKSPLGIVAVYGNWIPQSWLDYFPMIVNIHPSLLPAWRGAAPVIRSVQVGEATTGVTIFKLVKAMDAGPIIDQVKVKVKPNQTTGELTDQLFELGANRLVDLLKEDFWVLKAQDHLKATLTKKVNKAEAEIDWKQPAKVILNQIRAFNPYPGAYTFVRVKGKKMRLKIWTAHI